MGYTELDLMVFGVRKREIIPILTRRLSKTGDPVLLQPESSACGKKKVCQHHLLT